ncbi:MAG: nucleotide exchange factor GrpE [Vulcanimicrobiaceae bacterium]
MPEDPSQWSTEAGEAVLDGVDSGASDRDRLSAELEAAKALAEENYKKYLLSVADFENYKKRQERDEVRRASAHRFMLLERLLPVIDNLERALQYDSGGDVLRGGIEQTLKGFEAILASEGVTVIDVLGKPFDPRVAEAIATSPAGDDVSDDTVTEVAQKGYVVGEHVLRPAKVIVAKHDG